MVLGGKVGACVKEECFWLVLLASGACDVVICHCHSNEGDSMVAVQEENAWALEYSSPRF